MIYREIISSLPWSEIQHQEISTEKWNLFMRMDELQRLVILSGIVAIRHCFMPSPQLPERRVRKYGSTLRTSYFFITKKFGQFFRLSYGVFAVKRVKPNSHAERTRHGTI